MGEILGFIGSYLSLSTDNFEILIQV
jgi:hypothetical protein